MIEDLLAWVGRTKEVSDILEPSRIQALSAALGQECQVTTGDPLPLLYHWLYFWDVRSPAGLGPDGHPARGDFLPPVSLPRRMWAGGRLRFLEPLHVGDPVRRRSTILNIEAKSGRSGVLVFVSLLHEIFGPLGLAIREEQDIVYREATPPQITPQTKSEAANTPLPSDWCEQISADPILLFRYSALTMNAHRIHYDRHYAVQEEGYPGLVVHGPLQATLMIDLAQRKLSKPIAGFEFRALAPAFDGRTLDVRGGRTVAGAELWVEQNHRRSIVGAAIAPE